MRLISVFRKTMREQLRDFWTLSLTMSLGPFFVFFYWLMFGGGSTTYDVLVINRDAGIEINGERWNAGDQTIAAIEDVKYESGQSIVAVKTATDRTQAEKQIKDRKAELLLVFPENYSQALMTHPDNPAHIELVGDLTNPYYSVSSVITNAALTTYLQSLSPQASPIAVDEHALGDSGARTEFETWVPGLFMMAAVLLIYQTAMTVAREIEGGTMRRLQITPMTAFDLLGGISVSQVLIGVTAVILTFLTAVALGFHSEGPLWIAVLLGVLTSMAMIGVGLVVACFARTVARAFMIANFPLFLMTFFSGMFMPISAPSIVTIGGRTIRLLDFLPPTFAVTALNKVTSLGAGLGDIAFELAALSILATAYFAVGVWLFQRLGTSYPLKLRVTPKRDRIGSESTIS
jgi:ABC-2 type transport system permease protein